MCVLVSLQLLSATLLNLSRTLRDMITNVQTYTYDHKCSHIGLHVTYPLFLPDCGERASKNCCRILRKYLSSPFAEHTSRYTTHITLHSTYHAIQHTSRYSTHITLYNSQDRSEKRILLQTVSKSYLKNLQR